MSRAGIISDNSIYYVDALITIWNQGDSAVLIDWRIPSVKVVEMLYQADVTRCYVEERHYDSLLFHIQIVPSTSGSGKTINLTKIPNAHKETVPIPSRILDLFQANESDKEAVVFFSSGTTGRSKGISLSHQAISQNADAVRDYMLDDHAESIFIVKTLSHSSTLTAELLVGLRAGIKIYLSSSIVSPRMTLRALNRTKAEILCVNPTVLAIYSAAMPRVGSNLAYLRKIYVSGSVLRSDQMDIARNTFKGVKIYNVYGLTEAGPRVCAQTDENYDLQGTVGKPLRGVEIRIEDQDNKQLPQGVIGTVKVKTRSCYTRYLNDQNTSADHDGNSFINTGDSGYLDGIGNLFIMGRTDEMIIKGSHNIFPDDIEKEILVHQHVDDCIVFGYEDALYGQIMICLFVSPDAGVTADSLKNSLRTKLAPYEVPDIFIPVAAIPLTPNGKKSRQMARLIYKEDEKTTGKDDGEAAERTQN